MRHICKSAITITATVYQAGHEHYEIHPVQEAADRVPETCLQSKAWGLPQPLVTLYVVGTGWTGRIEIWRLCRFKEAYIIVEGNFKRKAAEVNAKYDVTGKAQQAAEQ